MAIRTHRVRTRNTSVRNLVVALDGPEKPYDVYRFANGKKRVERPKHNPFRGL